MFKKIFVATLIYAVLILLLHQAVYGNEFTILSVSDSIFYVAIVIFFLSLMSITQAGNLFSWFAYSVKGLFNRGSRGTPYHQYLSQKIKKNVSIIPPYLLILSILLIILSVILGLQVI
jgi:hypothetical protein